LITCSLTSTEGCKYKKEEREKYSKIGHFCHLGVEKMFTKKFKLEEKKVIFERKTAL